MKRGNARGKKRRQERQEWYQALKATHGPCMDCGQRVQSRDMHWDHRPGTVKVGNVADLVDGGRPKEVILAEIEKCDLVCAGCHAKRGYDRGQLTGLN